MYNIPASVDPTIATPESKNAAVSVPAELHIKPTVAPQSYVLDDWEAILARIRAKT